VDPIIQVVQEQAAFSAAAVASIGVAVPNTRPGSVLHVWATCVDTSAITSITDDLAQSYGSALNNLVSAGNRRVAQFSLAKARGGSITVTAHFVANSPGGIWVAEVANAASPFALDGNNGLVQVMPGLAANAIRSSFLVATKKPVLVLALSMDMTLGLKINAGTGFTSTVTGWDAGGGNLARSEYKRSESLGSQEARFTALSNDTFITMGANYDEAPPPAVGWVVQVNNGPKPFQANRVDGDPTTTGRQTLHVGNFESAAIAMAAVDQQMSRVLKWAEDVRFDGVVSFTGT